MGGRKTSVFRSGSLSDVNVAHNLRKNVRKARSERPISGNCASIGFPVAQWRLMTQRLVLTPQRGVQRAVGDVRVLVEEREVLAESFSSTFSEHLPLFVKLLFTMGGIDSGLTFSVADFHLAEDLLQSRISPR